MILWPGSKRRCRPADAAEIAATHRRRVELAGVFVNATLDQVALAADEIGLTMLQFHGDEGPSFCAEAGRRTGCRVIKAARVRSGAEIQALAPFHTDFHLLDTYVEGVPGGTGETFAWELARDTDRAPRVPVILAGGLTADNVAEAIATVHPYAVDVASGTESAPGIKDHDKLRAFAAAVASTQPAAPEPAAAERDAAETEIEAEPVAAEPSRGADRDRGADAMSAVEHRFGPYGGQYVPETLMPALAELELAWIEARDDPASSPSAARCARLRRAPVAAVPGRRLSEAAGHEIYLKREDLNHTGAHKINNALGQALLARRMGKPRIIAETGAGQHGVATATACALLDLECVVYMGTEDMRRQKPNVERMGLLGATVEPVDAGTRTLKEATSAAIRDWVTNVADDPLHHRLGRRPGAVSRARARPAAGDRRRGPGADPAGDRPAAASG